jgi:exopolysaccharide biosynthesis polyprenyl glycosylphosphotransferase
MFPRRRYLLNTLKILDLSIMLGAFGLASVVAYYQVGKTFSFAEFIHMRVEVHNLFILSGLAALWHLSFRFFGSYRSRRLSSRRSEILDVVKAASVGTVIVLVASVLFRFRIATPAFLATFWLASSGLLVGSRLALRHFLGSVRRRGRNLRNLLIVGTNARTFAFARQIDARPDLGYQLMGFVDEAREGVEDEYLARYGRVCDFDGFPAFLRAHVVDEVVVALPVRSLYGQAARIVAVCEEQGIIVRFISSIFDNRLGHSHVDQFADYPVVTVSTGAMYGLSTGVKRALDVCVSALALLLFAPLAGVIMLAVRLTSPGPAHFAQERLGLNKHTFRLYKFRTMVAGAEAQRDGLEPLNEADGPVFKMRHDPRVTPVGRWLRKTSLDELPQLFNVLRGDMSLVGPRPLPVRDYAGFNEDWHRRRFSVRPGMTCLWQVHGRSDASFERWMALDMEYIDSWSLALDVQILASTVSAVFRQSGAM